MNRGGIRRCVAFGLCALISLTVSGSVSASAAPAGFRVLVSRAVVPGVRYIKLQNPTTPNLVYILRVNLTKPIKFGVGLAARKKAGFERTSAMAARYNAIAGINGDFDIWWSRPNRDFARMGRPGHDLAQNGSVQLVGMSSCPPETRMGTPPIVDHTWGHPMVQPMRRSWPRWKSRIAAAGALAARAASVTPS